MSTEKKKINIPSKNKKIKTKPSTQDNHRNNKGQFTAGNSGNPYGPCKGYKKKTLEIRLAFMEAFDKMGGVEGLVNWAKEKRNTTDFYRILAHLLPKDIDLGVQDDLIEKYKEFTANELIKKSKELAESVLGLTRDKRSDNTQKES